MPFLCGACAAGSGSLPLPTVVPLLAPFLGHYRGLLHIHGSSGSQTVPMGLEVDAVLDRPEQVQFVLVYGEGASAQRRDYLLGLDDAATGRCHIDERNGIVLAAWLVDNELVSAFSVQGQTNVVRYRVTAEGVEFALEALAAGEGEATGEGVLSHVRVTRQRALLRRGGG